MNTAGALLVLVLLFFIPFRFQCGLLKRTQKCAMKYSSAEVRSACVFARTRMSFGISEKYFLLCSTGFSPWQSFFFSLKYAFDGNTHVINKIATANIL